jgi:hypothetical protein
MHPWADRHPILFFLSNALFRYSQSRRLQPKRSEAITRMVRSSQIGTAKVQTVVRFAAIVIAHFEVSFQMRSAG